MPIVSSTTSRITNAVTQTGDQKETVKEPAKKRMPLLAKALTLPYFMLPLGVVSTLFAPSEAEANDPQREKAVAAFAQESWKPLQEAMDQRKKVDEVVPNSKSLWNNIQAVLEVTDDTMVKDIVPLRAELIKRGATNPNIPPRIVHSALYTTGVFAQNVNKAIDQNEKQIAELKKEQGTLQKKVGEITGLKAVVPQDLTTKGKDLEQKVSALQAETAALKAGLSGMSANITPFMGRVIVDTKTKDNRSERHLVKPGEVEYLRRSYTEAKVYSPRNFDKLAGYVLAQINEGDLAKKIEDEMFSVGNDTARRREFFDFFFSLNPSTVSQNVRDKSQEWIFGKDQIDGLRKKDKKENKTPATIIIAPAPWMPHSPLDKKDTSEKKPQAGPVPPGTITIQLPPGTVIQPTTTPGIPRGARTGSLEQLTELDKRLTAIYLPYYSSKEVEEQQFVADNILMLAQAKDELTVTIDSKEQKIESALVASAQWFALKHYSDSDKTVFTAADYTVLKSLATIAKDNKLAFNVLKRTLGSFPDLYSNSYFRSVFSLSDTAERRAGVEIVKTFNANKESAREFLIQLADRKAALIWTEPTDESDMKDINNAREAGRHYALVTMANVDKSHSFIPYMREITRNPFAKEIDKLRAMIGVALAKDGESVGTLLNIAADESQDEFIRSLALEAVLYIDTPDVIPESIRKKAAGESPFAPSKLQYAYPVRGGMLKDSAQRPIREILSEIEKSGPFRSRIRTQFNSWLEEQTRLNNSQAQKGREPVTITDLQKLEALMQLRKQEFGGSRGLLSARAATERSFKTQLDGMVRYLDSCKEKNKRIDLNLALPMMDILARAGEGKATTVLADIATYPEQYVRSNPDAKGFFAFFDLFRTAIETTILKWVAIEDLGGTCSLKDSKDRGSEVIHAVAGRDTSRLYRRGAQTALKTLADRYDAYAREPHPLGQEDLDIQAARKYHAEQALRHMKYHALGLEDYGQMALVAMQDEYRWAGIVDSLGGTKELLSYALEASKKDERAQVVRSVMHALRANGKKAEDVSRLGLEVKSADRLAQLYNSVNRQEFWLGDNQRKQTGKGVSVAVHDGGYVYPVEKFLPGIEKKIVYPEKIITWSDMTNWVDLHPTMVAGTIYQRAPEIDNLFSYSFIASTPEVPHRPFDTQDSAIYAEEDMAQKQIRGEATIDVSNYSWGYINILLANENLRNDIVDLLGAFMEVNSRMGTKHTVAAGNANGVLPGFVRWANEGEVNNTGLRYDNNGKARRPSGVLPMAAAGDFYRNMLAEFSSVNDPLRTFEAIQLLSFQGVHVMTPLIENNEWKLGPVSGTSFAAPSEAFLVAWGISARRTAKLPELSSDEWEQILQKTATKQLPHREDWEGGKYLDVTAYLQEVLRPRAPQQPAAQPAILNKK